MDKKDTGALWLLRMTGPRKVAEIEATLWEVLEND